jgi:hypothetical protein
MQDSHDKDTSTDDVENTQKFPSDGDVFRTRPDQHSGYRVFPVGGGTGREVALNTHPRLKLRLKE